MTDHDPPARGRHAASGGPRRRAPLLLGLATAVGLWLGISAPEVSPVTPTTPAAAVQPTADTTPQPVAVPPDGPRRGGR